MTITNWDDGFETGGTGEWTSTSGTTLSVDGTYKHCGDEGLRAFRSSSGSCYVTHQDGSGVGASQYSYARFVFKFPTMPTGSTRISLYRIRDGNGDMAAEVSIIQLTGSSYDIDVLIEPLGGGYHNLGTETLVAGTWYCLQVRCFRNDTTGNVGVYLDGNFVGSKLGDTKGTFNHNYFDLGAINTTAAVQVYLDDFEIDPSAFPSCISLPPAPTNVAATINQTDTVTITWTKATGATGYTVWRDGDLIHTLGDVATVDDNGADPPVISVGNAIATDGTFGDKVALSLSSAGIVNGTTHSYDVFSLNACGDGGSDSDTGYRVKGSITYLWKVDDTGGYDDIPSSNDPTFDYTIAKGAPPPTITKGNTSATEDETTHVALSLIGTSSNNGLAYDYKCTLSSPDASSKTSGANSGYCGADVTLSYQWQRSAGDSDASYSNLIGATSSTYDDSAAPSPTITPGTATASDGTYVSKIELSLSGASANIGATRYYRCVLNADNAVQKISTADSGNIDVGSLTYQWRRSAGVTDDTYSNLAGAQSVSHSDTTAPANGDYRWYYCRLNAAGAIQQDSTHNRGYRDTLNTMIGTPTGWTWGTVTAGVSQVRITSDNGLSWVWGTATGTIKVPNGNETGWDWQTVTL